MDEMALPLLYARGALLAEELPWWRRVVSELTVGFARFGGEIQDKASTLKGGEKGAYRHNLLSIVQNDFATLFRGDVTGSIQSKRALAV